MFRGSRVEEQRVVAIDHLFGFDIASIEDVVSGALGQSISDGRPFASRYLGSGHRNDSRKNVSGAKGLYLTL